MGPDDICKKFIRKKIAFKTYVKDGFMFMEGNKDALEFISELFKAQALYAKDDGFHIDPQGAGSSYFKKGSEVGIYIKRV